LIFYSKRKRILWMLKWLSTDSLEILNPSLKSWKVNSRLRMIWLNATSWRSSSLSRKWVCTNIKLTLILTNQIRHMITIRVPKNN
jgi:hypothetical protein